MRTKGGEWKRKKKKLPWREKIHLLWRENPIYCGKKSTYCGQKNPPIVGRKPFHGGSIFFISKTTLLYHFMDQLTHEFANCKYEQCFDFASGKHRKHKRSPNRHCRGEVNCTSWIQLHFPNTEEKFDELIHPTKFFMT